MQKPLKLAHSLEWPFSSAPEPELIAHPSPIPRYKTTEAIARPIFRASSIGIVNDWHQQGCSAVGWNLLDIPTDWTDILVYVVNVDWFFRRGDSDAHVTAPGPPGTGTSLIMAASGHTGWMPITATDPSAPQRYFGHNAPFYTTTGDHYDEDNTGGFIIAFKQRT